jgi:hypothetical protein
VNERDAARARTHTHTHQVKHMSTLNL